MSELAEGAAFVTGGGSGIGRAIALAFAARGAAVGVMDLHAETAERVAEEIQSTGGRSVAVQGDVSRWDDVDRAVSATVEALGPLGIMVTAAGILDGYRLAEDTTPELWERTIAINLSGTFYCCKRALAEMVPARRGRLITIASAAGLVGDGGGAAYVASKHGVVGLTRRLAVTYGSRGITANAICPGPVETDLRTNSMEILGPSVGDMRGVGRTDEQVRQFFPLGRRAQPAEIAAAACYLASPEAAYVTGLMLSIDGGWVAM
ncbi:MAG: SDR family oxidoreductase [Chloroflexota bacterium]|nr:SDR family oxidoreductase [Chloroflexota bacterium]